MVFALGILFIAAVIGVELYTRHRRRKAVEAAPLVAQSAYQMKADRIRLPGGVYFHPGHTWGYLAPNGNIQTGVDDFLLHVTGPPSKVTIPDENERIEQGKPFVEIHQNGHSLVLTAPVSGQVKAINEAIIKDPASLVKQPYRDNWICEVEADDWQQDTRGLMLGQRAGDWLRSEMRRLKDFFASMASARDPELATMILQDGGEVADRVLQYQDKDVWQAFQSDFLDNV